MTSSADLKLAIETQVKLKRKKTQELYSEACQIIPGGVNSPVRSCKEIGITPLIVEKGLGEKIIDIDGNEFIDFCGSWGALIHGHAHPTILEALEKRMRQGTTFGITHVTEMALAKEIIKLVPSIEKIRFVSTGTEATMTAIRLARGYTKRNLIVKFIGNFHGHVDSLLVQAGSGLMSQSIPSSAGIPEEISQLTLLLPYNDLESIERTFHPSSPYADNIAAVILEPIAANMGVVPPLKSFLELLRKKTEETGSLLIFDEVITGFRVALQGAQGLYQIKPDLTCFGKIIGGGLPAAALGGRKEIMDYLAPIGTVYQAGTLSGNPLAMEAGYQALKLLQVPDFYEELQKKTDFLLKPIEREISENDLNMTIQRQGSMFTLFFGQKKVCNGDDAKNCDKKRFAEFFCYMLQNGIYIPPLQQEAWFISSAHEYATLKKTQGLILDYLAVLSG